MITLNFKNQHISFAVESVISSSDFSSKLKVQLNSLFLANSDDQFIQSVQLTGDEIIMIYKTVTAQSEGIARIINKEMEDALLPQLTALSNMADVQAGTAAPNEAAQVLIQINDISNKNLATKNAKILSGKTAILSIQ